MEKDWIKRHIHSLNHRNIFKRHYSRMICVLPIDDLIPELDLKDLLTGNLKAEINSKVTRADKIKHLLDSMEGGLKIGKPVKFERFLCVLVAYLEREKDLDVENLIKDIYKENCMVFKG